MWTSPDNLEMKSQLQIEQDVMTVNESNKEVIPRNHLSTCKIIQCEDNLEIPDVFCIRFVHSIDLFNGSKE